MYKKEKRNDSKEIFFVKKCEKREIISPREGCCPELYLIKYMQKRIILVERSTIAEDEAITNNLDFQSDGKQGERNKLSDGMERDYDRITA